MVCRYFCIVFMLYSFAISSCNTVADANDQGRSSAVAFNTKQSPEPTPLSISLPLETKECGERRARVLLVSAMEGDGRAAEEYEKLINEGCDVAYTRYLLGRALRADKQYARAAEQFRTSIRMNPKEWAPHNVLAETLIVDLGEFDEGLRELEAARKIDDLDDLSYSYDYYEGRALEGLGKLQEALIHFHKFERRQSKINKNDEELVDARKRIAKIETALENSGT